MALLDVRDLKIAFYDTSMYVPLNNDYFEKFQIHV